MANSKRHQRGQIIEASNSFYCRFYRNGKRVAERLCAKDDKHHSADCKAVKLLRDKFMLRVNTESAPSPSLTVGQFWESDFLPYIEENLKPSSIHSYKAIWRRPPSFFDRPVPSPRLPAN